MKKTLLIVSILAGAAGAYAQATINWGDAQTGFTISIVSPNPADPTVEQTGNTSWDTPSGAATYGGGWIGGGAAPGGGIGATPTDGPGGFNYALAGNFEVGLYLAASQAALTSDIKTGAPLATGPTLGGANAGLYGVSLNYVSSFPAGSKVYVGIASWYDAGGAGSYEAAFADGDPNGYVEATSSLELGTTPASLAGLGITSFSLVTTPAVSSSAPDAGATVALLSVSFLGLATLRRRLV
jgi:hypothetical protein